MKHILLIVVFSLIAQPLWADFGISNIITKEIHRMPIPEETPKQENPAQETLKSIPFTKTSFYPFTIHLSSWKDPQAAVEHILSQIEPVFITKIQIGNDIWYRVDYGCFQTIKDAVLKKKELEEKKIIEVAGSFIGTAVPFTIELGTFDSEDKAKQEQQRIKNLGIISYKLKESEGINRILYGAYPDMKSAEIALSDLKAVKLYPKIKKR